MAEDTPINIPVAPAPELPPAAVIVKEGIKTERELELEKRLTDAESARKKAETDAAYAQDEARRLKESPPPPPVPTPTPRAKKGPGWTLLHGED